MFEAVPFLILLLAGVAAVACYFFISLQQSHAAIKELRRKAASVLDVVAEREQVQQEKARIQVDRQKASAELVSLEGRLRVLRSEETALRRADRGGLYAGLLSYGRTKLF